MRLLLVAIVLIVAAGLVAACSGSDAPDAPGDADAPAGAVAAEVEADSDAGDAPEERDADAAEEDAAEEEQAGAEPPEAGTDQTAAGEPEDAPAAEESAAVAPTVAPLPYDNDNALRVLETLSVTIGQRVQATDGERAAAAFLAAEFESAGYVVELQPVPLESLRVEEFGCG